MDKEEFDKTFNLHDKMLWRSINKSGTFRKRKKTLRENDFESKHMENVEEEKSSVTVNVNDQPSTSNIFEDNEINLCENDLHGDFECDDHVSNDDFCEDNSCENDWYEDDDFQHLNKGNMVDFRNDL